MLGVLGELVSFHNNGNENPDQGTCPPPPIYTHLSLLNEKGDFVSIRILKRKHKSNFHRRPSTSSSFPQTHTKNPSNKTRPLSPCIHAGIRSDQIQSNPDFSACLACITKLQISSLMHGQYVNPPPLHCFSGALSSAALTSPQPHQQPDF